VEQNSLAARWRSPSLQESTPDTYVAEVSALGDKMQGVVPSDFKGWVTEEKGLRIVAFAEKIGFPMRYDGEIESIKILCVDWEDIIVKKRSDGILRSPMVDLKSFWKAWRVENPDERQFCSRPMATEFPDEKQEVGDA